MNSQFLKLDWRDLLRGAIVALLTAVAGYLTDLVSLTNLDWAQLGDVALLALFGYLAKSLLSDSQGKLGGKL